MQAVQAVESAALQAPRRSSPFRALVWKEWRQQRWIFLSLGGLAYALLILSLFIPDEGRNFVHWRGAFEAAAALIGMAGILVCSANAFSGERDDSTEQFLDTIPCSRGKLFGVKMGFLVFLAVLELPAIAAGFISYTNALRGVMLSGLEFASLIAAGLVLVMVVPALIASFGGSVIATILASLPVIGACWAYTYSPAVLAQFLPIKSEVAQERLAVLFTVLMLATVFLAAWRMWIRVERTWCNSAGPAAFTASLLFSYFALPVIPYVLFPFVAGGLTTGTEGFAGVLQQGGSSSALVFGAGLAGLAIVSALGASFGRSATVTTAAFIPAAAGSLAWTVYSARVLEQLLPVRAETAFLWLCPILVATLLLAAWRLWAQVARKRRKSAWVAAAVLIAYAALPIPGGWLYVTCLAPIRFFAGGEGRPTKLWLSGASPDGKYLAFCAQYNGWGAGWGRTALADADSGRTRWLTRFRDSSVGPGSRFWSPSGNQFALTKTDVCLWPFARDEAKPFKSQVFVADARSGLKQSLDELCPGLPELPSKIYPLVGWYGEHVFAIQDGRDMFFADIGRHEVKECKMPGALPSATLPHFRWLPITRRGVFAAPEGVSGEGEVRVLRFAPELQEAETLVLRGALAAPERLKAGQKARHLVLLTASEDGHWLLLRCLSEKRDNKDFWTVNLARSDNAACLMPLTDSDRKDALLPASWGEKGFLPGSHQVLLLGDAEIGLFDADSHELRRIPVKEAKDPQDRRFYCEGLSPKGRFVIVWCGHTAAHAESVVDLRLGTSWSLGDVRVQWLGEDHLILFRGGAGEPWIINRDGTGARRLLK